MRAARSFAAVVMLGAMALAVEARRVRNSDSGKPKLPDTNIEGSVETNLAEFPSMALVEEKRAGSESWSFLCSAVVLDERHVLTAMSCVKISDSKYQVKIGCDDLSQCKESHQYQIDKMLTYPTREKDSGDFAILRLKEKIKEFGTLIKQAKMAAKDISTNSDKTVKAVGWGRSWMKRISETGFGRIIFDQSELERRFSTKLRKAEFKFQSSSNCGEKFDSLNVSVMICATDQGGEHNYKFDLGGPLFYGKGAEQQLVGFYTLLKLSPFMFQDVTKFRELIQGCMGSEPKCEAIK